MVQTGFIFSIAALSVTLAGFSGLVAAIGRGANWNALAAFRLRQIPEMGLATALIALLTIPAGEIFNHDAAVVRIMSALALSYMFAHALVLFQRTRQGHLALSARWVVTAGVLDTSIYIAATLAIILSSLAAYELLLIFLLARPMAAFVLVLGEISTGG